MRHVFSLDLKTATESLLRTVFGIEFQSACAEHGKAIVTADTVGGPCGGAGGCVIACCTSASARSCRAAVHCWRQLVNTTECCWCRRRSRRAARWSGRPRGAAWSACRTSASVRSCPRTWRWTARTTRRSSTCCGRRDATSTTISTASSSLSACSGSDLFTDCQPADRSASSRGVISVKHFVCEALVH